MAFVGVQPLFTQVPPNLSFSTTATFMPALDSRAARAGPAWPVPMISASKSVGMLGFSHGQFPVGADEMAAVATGIAQQVVLMLRLGLPEITRRSQFRDDLARPQV